MSRTVDERVVSMQFDNRQFESNVKTSMSTLEKLKQSLKLTEASKGLEGIGSAVKQVDMSPMVNGIETVKMKFSALEVMAVTALANITNSAVNAGKRMISAITIDPIKAGFAEYETQMNAVQTILANTQKEGTNVKVVNAALDELNRYADKTIYNFTEMTRNIGTFTAAGVKLDTSVSSIKGIANLAAVSGSSSQQASTAMYQLSQAIASGTVKLMDWNSVVNAGMGGQVFQDALIRTSEHLQTGAKAAIDAKGSFRESLQTGWLTTEVLTQTLDQFATAADTQEEYEAAVQKFVSQGYTQEEAKQMADMAKTAGEAATKVKTFSQLIDTLKEALGSGWTETWRTVIGDFEEARGLWTSVSAVLSEYINKTSEARNAMLKEWADLGGRSAMIESFKNVFKGLLSIVKPIKEAFREIFPPMTAQQLFKITEGIRDLTAKFILSDSAAAKLKTTFKGIFSVVDIGITFLKDLAGGVARVVGSLFGFSGGILDITAALGEWVSNLRDSIKHTDIFGNAIDKIVGFLTTGIDKLKEFGSTIKSSFSSMKDSFKGPSLDGFIGFLKNLAGLGTKIGSGLVSAIKSIVTTVSDVLSGGDILNVLNNGLFAGVLLYISKFFKNLSNVLDNGLSFLENVTGILDDVRSCFEAYQNNLKAETLTKIATAIGILAASIWVISTIDAESMSQALVGITVLFGELLGSLSLFEKMDVKLKGVTKAITMMIGMSVAVLILSGALKIISNCELDDLARGLIGVSVLVGVLVAAARLMNTESKSITKFAGQMILMSAAIGMLALVAKSLSSMSWEELAKGGAGILGLVVMLVAAAKIMDGENATITKFAGQMLLMSAAIGILAIVGRKLSSMSWEELAKGGAGILGLVVMLVAAAKIMDGDSASITKFAGQMLLMSVSLAILAPVLKSLGSMSLESIVKGLAAIGVALAELAMGLHFMKGTLGGSAALLVASVALKVLASVLTTLGSMSVGEIVKSLITLGAAMAVIGVAASLLSPVIPAMLGLAVAFALLGASMVGIGAGLTLIGIGLTSIAAAGTAAATSLVASIGIIVTGILELIPTIMEGLGEAIVAFCELIGDVAPQIAEAFLKLITSVMESLAEYGPQIIDSLVTFLVGVLGGLTERLPEFLDTLANFVVTLINGLTEHIGEFIDAGSNLLSAILNGIFESLGSMIETVIAPILESISNFVTRLIEVLQPIMPNIQGIVEAISSAVSSICDAFITLVSQIAPIIDSISNLIKQMGDSISQVLQSVADTIQTCGDTISQVLESIAETIDSVFTGISEVITSIGESIKSVLEGIADVIESIGKAALDAGTGFENLANGVKTITGLNLLDMVTSLGAVADGIKDIASNSEGLAAAGSGMQQIANGTTLSATAFNTMSMGISMVVQKLTSIGSTAVTAMSMLTTAVSGSASCFVTLNTTATSAIISMMSTLATTVMSGSALIASAFNQMMSSAVVAITSRTGSFILAGVTLMIGFRTGIMAGSATIAPTMLIVMTRALSIVISRCGMFMTAGLQLMVGFRTGIMTGSAGVISALTMITMRAYTTILSRRGQFMMAGVQLMMGLSSGIRAGSSGIASSISRVVASCVSGIRIHYFSFFSAGLYLGQGLTAGIAAQETAAYNAGFRLGKAAVEGEKAGQKSKSPSKATKQAGKWLGEGLIIGMDQMGRAVYRSGEAMGANAVDSISGALSTIQNISDDDTSFLPTIRPVVDMADLQSGSRTLQIGADLSARLLTKPVSSLEQIVSDAQAQINASNNEVIQTINGLREDLNQYYAADDSEIALYVDSKKLASSIAKPMNRQLNILSKRGAY